VVYALSSTGWNVTIIPARKEDEGQARDLAADIQSKIEDREATIISMLYSPTPPVSQAPKLIVNCTPLGMSPNVEASPWPEGVSFPRGAVVYDLVYNPSVTKFMAAARAAGLAASTGLGMLVSQAALSFERWTGLKPPFDPMFRAASEALETVPHR
jgi:shikimate dehydrogenase